MSMEKFTATTAERLADDLTAFAYARDRTFAINMSDVSRHVVERELRVMAGEDSDEVLELCDKERISLAAYRNYYLPGGKVPRPSDFTLVHRQIAQIDTLPFQLRHVLDPSLVEQYDFTESGDLNEVRQVEYGVILDPDGEIFIGRDITYRLRDIKKTIYKAQESKLPKSEQVYVASEDARLQVRTAILPETIDDLALQVQVGVEFCNYTLDEIVAMEQHWLDVEQRDQIACINAIMNSLLTGRKVKEPA